MCFWDHIFEVDQEWKFLAELFHVVSWNGVVTVQQHSGAEKSYEVAGCVEQSMDLCSFDSILKCRGSRAACSHEYGYSLMNRFLVPEYFAAFKRQCKCPRTDAIASRCPSGGFDTQFGLQKVFCARGFCTCTTRCIFCQGLWFLRRRCVFARSDQ